MDEGAKIPQGQGILKPEPDGSSGKTGRPSRRALWLSLAVFFVAGFIAWFWWESAHRPPPQIITLPNGERYQCAGVTYGTNNVPPYFPARLVHWLPKRLAETLRKFFGPRLTQSNGLGPKIDTPRLFVWFRRLESNAPASNKFSPPMMTARLADQSGLEAGGTRYAVFATNYAWSCVEFSVFPRRSRILQCNLYPLPGSGNSPVLIGSVTFPNPLYRQFAQWQPDHLPVSKRAGDLEVRLGAFDDRQRVAGVKVSGLYRSRELMLLPPELGEATDTSFDFSVNSPGTNDDMWVLHRAGLSDATGNVLRGTDSHPIISSTEGNLWRSHGNGAAADSGYIVGTLWPDEAAWRLKLEFKRAYGYAPEDVITFKNVPVSAVGTTNVLRLTNNVGGTQIITVHFMRGPRSLPGTVSIYSQVSFELAGKMTNVAVDYLGATSDAGPVENSGMVSSENMFALTFSSIPTNAHTMDFTFVVQKTRSVEFMVKPPKSN